MRKMTQAVKNVVARQPQGTPRPLRASIPIKATAWVGENEMELEGRLEAIGERQARIFFNRPLKGGTRLSLVVEFKDRRNREIRFQYNAKVTSSPNALWHEADVDLGQAVGVSGKDARQILSDLLPEED